MIKFSQGNPYQQEEHSVYVTVDWANKKTTVLLLSFLEETMHFFLEAAKAVMRGGRQQRLRMLVMRDARGGRTEEDGQCLLSMSSAWGPGSEPESGAPPCCAGGLEGAGRVLAFQTEAGGLV